MDIPVIRPEGSQQQLKLGDNTVAANPHLIFATTEDLYSLKPQIVNFPPGPTYRLFTAYRVMEAVRTEGVNSPGVSDEVTALRQARASMKADKKCPDEDVTSYVKRLFGKARGLCENVPEVPLTKESKILPAGSLLLCQQDADGADTWYAVTPDQFGEENLQRACINGQGVIEAFSSTHYQVFQRDFLRGWPDKNRAAHLNDLEALLKLEKPAQKKPTGNKWFDRFIGIDP